MACNLLPATVDGTLILFLGLSETLVYDLTVPIGGLFEDDLDRIQTLDALEDNVPAFILARLAPSDWTLVCYVPDSATVRDKVSIIWADL